MNQRAFTEIRKNKKTVSTYNVEQYPGKLLSIIHYKNDVPEAMIEFEDGKKSLHTKFRDDGVTVFSISQYKNEKKHHYSRFTKYGALDFETEYQEGKKHFYKSFLMKNVPPPYTTEYKDNKKLMHMSFPRGGGNFSVLRGYNEGEILSVHYDRSGKLSGIQSVDKKNNPVKNYDEELGQIQLGDTFKEAMRFVCGMGNGVETVNARQLNKVITDNEELHKFADVFKPYTLDKLKV